MVGLGASSGIAGAKEIFECIAQAMFSPVYLNKKSKNAKESMLILRNTCPLPFAFFMKRGLQYHPFFLQK
jgi:hypothetical protein